MRTADRPDDDELHCKNHRFASFACNLLLICRHQGSWLWRFPVFCRIIPNLKGSSCSGTILMTWNRFTLYVSYAHTILAVVDGQWLGGRPLRSSMASTQTTRQLSEQLQAQLL